MRTHDRYAQTEIVLGQAITLWTIRIAAALYVAATASWLTRRDRLSRAAWTAACVLYLAHAAAAFQFYHGWSHRAAYRQTAEQTFEVFGLRWGGGLYFNYVFTAIWVVDAMWWWRGIDRYRRRPRAVATTVHAFFAFMFFNATVVFAAGWTRWLGLSAAAALAILWRRSTRPICR